MLYANYNLQRGDRDGDACAVPEKLPRWGGNDITAGTTVMQCTTPASGAGGNISIPAHVHKLQLNLLELGFLIVGGVDGKFGRGVEWAVREFQIYAKMTQVAKVKSDLSHRDVAGDAFWASLPLDVSGYVANDAVAAGSVIPTYKTDYVAAIAAVAATATSPATPAVPAISKYVDSLESVANGSLYAGRVSGVVNQATRDAIEHWLDNDYRCPVVIEEWGVNSLGERTELKHSNMWSNSSGGWSSLAYAVDFSNHYTYSQPRVATEYNVLGKRTGSIWGGLMSDTGVSSSPISQCWEELEVSPAKLIGEGNSIVTLNLPTSSNLKSTFKVVRAGAEAECFGIFDSMNAYDRALISLGLCHWTLGIAPGSGNGSFEDGELGAVLAYYKEKYPISYAEKFGLFDIDFTESWGADGSALKVPNVGGKYTCWIKWFDSEVNDKINVPNQIQNKKGDSMWFASWHWFFRLALTTRTVEDFRKTQWDMVRVRIKGMLDKEVSLNHGTLSLSNIKIGDIFTSEKAVAYLYRYHIWVPNRVAHTTYNIANNSASNPSLGMILKKAVDDTPTINWGLSVNNWTDSHEASLVTALDESLANTGNSTFSKIDHWAENGFSSGSAYITLGEFSIERDSFLFYDDNI